MANEAAEPIFGRLNDLVFDLVKDTAALRASLPPKLGDSFAEVVRRVNARCSAVIEGDAVDDSTHAAVEKRLDAGTREAPASAAFLAGIHRDLYGVDGPVANLSRFEGAYASVPGRFRQVLAVPASYQRLVQIGPFAQGNGVVARLMAHAALVRLEMGSFWSLARALSRDLPQYRELVAAPGESDDTGIFGNQALMEFCRFFLTMTVDEVRFMQVLLNPASLLPRVERYCAEELEAGRLPEGCYPVLREILLRGELPRGEVETLVPFRERKARQITSRLRESGLLASDGVRAPLRVTFSDGVLARWLPGLTPV